MPRDSSIPGFGARLGAVRRARGLTQASACDAIGASRTQWSNWERGAAHPLAEDLVKIAAGLSVSVHWLLTGEGPESSDLMRIAAGAAGAGVSAEAMQAAIRSMDSEHLRRLAEERRAEEIAAWREPVLRAVAALRDALKHNPPLAVRDSIIVAIDRLSGATSSEEAADGA